MISEEEKKDFLLRFAEHYENVYPEGKDIMRAETCKSLNMAYKQLKTIRDIPKFYRRLKAFLKYGFEITSLKGTAFENMECEATTKWLEACVKIYKESGNNSMADKKITRLATILSL